MDIWDWALETYARPGVSPACLRLQDEHGQNVSYLLWAVWAGSEDRVLLDRAAGVARAWDAAALHPLRAARRGLRAATPPVDDPGREALRQDVKAAELFAERLLMEALAAITGARAAG
jgi:uncharacterized protein (TIGR02444 family)